MGGKSLMQEITSRISDPIVPNVGLGGFRLRTPLEDLHTFLMHIYIERKGDSSWCSAESIFDIAYDLDPILLVVNAQNGKVGSVIARLGYLGTLFGRISVGMLIGDAMAIDDRLYYDEALEKVFVRDCPGVALWHPDNDPPPELVPSLSIMAIEVFVPEEFIGGGFTGSRALYEGSDRDG
jgi:hypothetical protein